MKSTFSRLFTTLSLILLTAMVLVSASFQWITNQYLKEQTITSIKNDANVVASLFRASYGDQSISSQDFYMALTVAVSVSGADMVICDAEGNLLMCADSPMGCEHTGLQLDKDYRDRVFLTGSQTDTGMVGGLYQENRYISSVAVTDPVTGAPLAIVMVSVPVDETLINIRRITNTFLLITLMVVVFSVVAMTYFVRRQSNPLRDMAKAAKAFGHGDFNARVSITGHNPQEVKELALAFNNMATSLEKGENQRKEFVANVSHELKTPMTTISGYVDGILDGTIPPEKSRPYLELVSQETKRLSRLVRSMLDISRLQDQGGMPEEQKTRFDLTELTGQVLISFEQKIIAKGIEVDVQMPDYPVFTRANQDAINQVIYNLVDNGVKFCPQAGTLGLTVREGKNKVYLSVSNDGDGIPVQELPMVFERFHKIDKSRSQNRDSWGLGLYIVKTILDSHGENISVTSDHGKTEFTFTLPLVR